MAEETYHGHNLTYSSGGVQGKVDAGDEDQAPALKIDNTDIEVVVHSDGTYSAKEHYYEKFGSVAALGRSIARRLPVPD